jgi:hypothetical protein
MAGGVTFKRQLIFCCYRPYENAEDRRQKSEQNKVVASLPFAVLTLLCEGQIRKVRGDDERGFNLAWHMARAMKTG